MSAQPLETPAAVLLGLEHGAALLAHLERHGAEDGHEGNWFLGGRTAEELVDAFMPACWTVEPGAVPWQRAWGWFDASGDIRAHALLTSNVLAPWRCNLGVGVELPWRAQGHGRRMASDAIRWGRTRPEVRWIDAWTFADNTRAVKLLVELGLRAVGRIDDAARAGGRSLTQVQLARDLMPQGAHQC